MAETEIEGKEGEFIFSPEAEGRQFRIGHLDKNTLPDWLKEQRGNIVAAEREASI